MIVFGFIAAAGVRIMIENQIDLASSKNLIVTAVTLIIGAGDFSLKIGGFGLGGIGTATVAAILLNLIMEDRKLKKSSDFLMRIRRRFFGIEQSAQCRENPVFCCRLQSLWNAECDRTHCFEEVEWTAALPRD